MPAPAGIPEKNKLLQLLFALKKQNNRAIFNRHENTPTNYTTRCTHPRTTPPAHQPISSTAVNFVWSFIWHVMWYGNIYIYQGHLPQARKHTHELYHTFYPPTCTPTTHPPPTDKPLQQYVRRYTGKRGVFGWFRSLEDAQHGKKRGRGSLFYEPRHLVDRERAATHQAPTPQHPPTDQPTTTAVQQQWSSTYRPIHHGSIAVRQHVSQRWHARSWVGFALSYDSPPSGGESEPSPGEAFHAPSSRSCDSPAVASLGTPRADVWGGHGTGVRTLGAGGER